MEKTLAALGPYRVYTTEIEGSVQWIGLARNKAVLCDWNVESYGQVLEVGEHISEWAIRLAQLEAGGWAIDEHARPYHPLILQRPLLLLEEKYSLKAFQRLMKKLNSLEDSPFFLEDIPARDSDDRFEQALYKARLGGRIVSSEGDFFIYETVFAKKKYLSLVMLDDEEFVVIKSFRAKKRTKSQEAKLQKLMKLVKSAQEVGFAFKSDRQNVSLTYESHLSGQVYKYEWTVQSPFFSWLQNHYEPKNLQQAVSLMQKPEIALDMVTETIQERFSTAGSGLLAAANPHTSARSDLKALDTLDLSSVSLKELRQQDQA